MNLFISRYTDISKIKQEFDVAIVYHQPKIYESLKKSKVLIDKNAQIVKENFFEEDSLVISDALSKYIKYRTFAIYINAIKYQYTIDIYGKRRDAIVKDYNKMLYTTKQQIAENNKAVTLSDTLLKDYEQRLLDVIVDCASYYHGKRFTKLYEESIETLWHLSNTLFEIFLYQHFKPVKYYTYLLHSYSFYFCTSYLKKYPFDREDVDSNYQLKAKTVSMIYKAFSENLSLKLGKKQNIKEKIRQELERLQTLERFEV